MKTLCFLLIVSFAFSLYSDEQLTEQQRKKFNLPPEKKLTRAEKVDVERADKVSVNAKKALSEYFNKNGIKWKWQIIAARPVGDFILLWISFPKVMDGGDFLIYSKKKKKIVGKFHGGILG